MRKKVTVFGRNTKASHSPIHKSVTEKSILFLLEPGAVLNAGVERSPKKLAIGGRRCTIKK